MTEDIAAVTAGSGEVTCGNVTVTRGKREMTRGNSETAVGIPEGTRSKSETSISNRETCGAGRVSGGGQSENIRA
jgi:hypothetical protein